MKKLLVVFGVVFLFLAGCEAEKYTVLIENKSTKVAVSFTYNGTQESLAPSTSKTYEVSAYTPPPTNIGVSSGALSVKMNTKGDTFTFVDVTPLTLNVTNNLSVDVDLKADNYIDNSGKLIITIPKNSDIKNAKIYTSHPNFTSDPYYKPFSNVPVTIDWDFDDGTKTMNVTIR